MFFWTVIMENCEDKCFLELFLKALSIKRKFKLYNTEKDYARCRKEDLCECNLSEFSKCYNSGCHSPNTGINKLGFCERIFSGEDSVQKFLLKSIFGFIGGILLTYIFFIFLVFSLNFTLKKATYICIVLGIILSLGLAFSVKIRCTVFLCIPQLFSKRGRQALLAYAFILALSGPAKNTLHNVEVMSESLACKQEELRKMENELSKCVQKPNSAAKKSIEKLIEKINSAVKDFKNFILHFYRTCYDILEAIIHSQKWLYSVTELCQKKMGRPSHRCFNLVQEASENCQGISPMRDWKRICEIEASTRQQICYSSETSFCHRVDVPWYLPADRLQNQLVTFRRRAMNILYVRVEGHQIYSQPNQSSIYYEEVQGVATEIRQKTDQFLQYFDFMSLIFGIFILVLFMKVIIYRYKFLTDDSYDNRYITHDFVDIDNTRAEFNLETLLPLEPKEKMKYIKVTSIRLVSCEKVRLVSSFIFLIFASFKIIVHMLMDSSLYWILSNIRREEKLLYMSSLKEEEPSITVRVEGNGFVADFVRNVTKAVKRQSATPRLDPTPCLPDPIPPDWNRYYQILALVVICWLLAVCEPYGLRLRHIVMVSYHPDRARERAIWLYNQIISDRSNFVKLARRDIRKKYKDISREDTLRFRFFWSHLTPRCVLCKVTRTKDFDLVKCTTSKCPGLFCVSCYECLKLCSICTGPAEYGDLSDISEEKDSSDEENLCKRPKRTQTVKKPVQKTEKAKESLDFKFRTPSFNFKSGGSKNADHAECFILPKLLGTFDFHKSKSSTTKEKNLSELESSDWETSFNFETPKKSENRKISSRKGGETAGRRKTKKLQKTRKCEENFTNDLDANSQKVCLFKKVSDYVRGKQGPCTHSPEKDLVGNLQPDFLFKRYNEGPQGDSDGNEDGCLLKTRDSIEMLSEQLKKNLGSMESSETQFPEGHFNVLTAIDGASSSFKSQDFLPAPIDVKYYEVQEKRFPFIDPINIHEMSHKWSESQHDIDYEESENSLSSERVRVRLPVSDSNEENLRLTIREQPISSPDSDCQFHQASKASVCNKKQREIKSGLKRTSGKINLNLKAQKFSSLYSIETDSSNERFLSVKPIETGRRNKNDWAEKKSKKKLKSFAGLSKRIKQLNKKVSQESKAARLLEMVEKMSVGEGGSSDTKIVEKTPIISKQDFEKLSKSLNKKAESGNKICLNPELVSKFLSSIKNGFN